MSLTKKIKTIIKTGGKGVLDGIHNFNNPNPVIEELAKERIQTCLGCDHFKPEPIPLFQVNDPELPEASKMYCNDCGCTLSYKLRQLKSPCHKWQQ